MKYHKYNKINIEHFKKFYDFGYSDSLIAKKLGASPSGVSCVRQRLNLAPNMKRILVKNNSLDSAPNTIYEKKKLRARQYKEDNYEKVKIYNSKWQKDHKKERNRYQKERRWLKKNR